jgi:hypothetical protein
MTKPTLASLQARIDELEKEVTHLRLVAHPTTHTYPQRSATEIKAACAWLRQQWPDRKSFSPGEVDAACKAIATPN